MLIKYVEEEISLKDDHDNVKVLYIYIEIIENPQMTRNFLNTIIYLCISQWMLPKKGKEGSQKSLKLSLSTSQ